MKYPHFPDYGSPLLAFFDPNQLFYWQESFAVDDDDLKDRVRRAFLRNGFRDPQHRITVSPTTGEVKLYEYKHNRSENLNLPDGSQTTELWNFGTPPDWKPESDK